MNIKEIIKDAKEHILEHGDHIPMLFCEFKGLNMPICAPIVGFGSMETTFEKQKVFFSIGRTLGQSYAPLSVSFVYFICEAWTSFVPHGETYKYDAPSQDPKRKEVLTVQVLDASQPPKLIQQMYVIEMLRDGSGELVDLLPKSQPVDEVYNRLLMAFLAGAMSAQLSEREYQEMLAKYL